MSTVDRVLPWRRHHEAAASAELTPLLAVYRRRHPKARVDIINRAYHMAAEAHRSQTRSSGESYINHPLAVATIVADIGLDDMSLAAALLHDAVEDTEITLPDVEEHFGAEVARLVDGVTKLERIQFDSREAQQAATMRKMLVAMAKDLRVLVIKLADRLHNMRTIAGMPHEKQQRIAQETLDIYAPLAHRLGIQEIKQQLEDLSFAALHPKRYAELDHLVGTRTPEREMFLAQAVAEIRARLKELGIEAEVTGRGKHLWSIYEKMVLKGREFDDIFDIVAVRVIVDSIKDCYAALGSIHGRWRPVVGRFKDYIAMPKFNLYQSLHTTVIGPSGRPIEVQIRTREMHQRAEWGVAAHWAYKGDGNASDIDWLNRIIDWQAEVSDPAQFMENLKTDLEQDEVFVFTPKGRVVTLPVGSTPIDFAYAVHTEVGHRCIGSKVNGRLVSLDHKLAERRHVRDLHVQGRDRRPVAGLARLRRLAPRPEQDPAVVQPRAAGRHDRSRPRRAHRRVPPREPAGAEDLELASSSRTCWPSSATSTSTPSWLRSASTTCRPAASPRRSPRRSTAAPATTATSCRPRCSRRAATAGATTVRSASTSRVSTTCSCGSPTAARRCPATRSSGSSPAAAASACTASTAPTPCRSPRSRRRA